MKAQHGWIVALLVLVAGCGGGQEPVVRPTPTNDCQAQALAIRDGAQVPESLRAGQLNPEAIIALEEGPVSAEGGRSDHWPEVEVIVGLTEAGLSIEERRARLAHTPLRISVLTPIVTAGRIGLLDLLCLVDDEEVQQVLLQVPTDTYEGAASPEDSP